MLTCNPSPFEDPVPEVDTLLADIAARINGEASLVSLGATEYEKKMTHVKRLLMKNQYDVEATVQQWIEWVKWRHEIMVDAIEEDEIKAEKEEAVFVWRGQNKEKMKCCVITGRALDPLGRKGTNRSFKRHFIKTVEDGLKAVDDDEQDKVCFIYDRRGLEFKHIDPNLFNFCKKVGEEMRDWYSDRVGVIYVVHMNFFFWILFSILVQPALTLFSPNFSKKFVMVETPEELLKYFDEEDLLLTRYEEGGDGASSAEVSPSSVDMSVIDEAQGRDNSVGKSNSNPAATSSASVVPPVVTLNAPQVEMRR